MKGMTTCKICGRDFPLLAEEHYIVRGIEKKANLIGALTLQDEAIQYDAFDCPHCGCQNVMQERKFKFGATFFTEDENEDKEEEEE